MELGRTSRTNLMLVGEVQDSAGRPHKVCYTTREQNEQLIALVTASTLRLSLERSALAIEPNSVLTFPIAIKRDASVASPIKVELLVQPHMRDISAAPVEAPANADTALFKIQLGPAPGPLNMPLVLRATAMLRGEPVVAEEPIELIRLP
jgi:hypothetical protein